ncbi:MAG TPA: D-2-hydroxyacid dehydrogenase [Fimbriimonas sp.]|nr:D-2-hydroxyacid dehydrogenase [Fimbriimonas sp.]
MNPLKVWTNVSLSDSEAEWLASQIAPHRLIRSQSATANNLVAGTGDDQCRIADVAFGQPDPHDIFASSTLKWVHITSAGFTRYDRQDLKQNFVDNNRAFTNSSSVYDDPCAQHVFACMLMHARQMLTTHVSHQQSTWNYDGLRAKERILQNDNILIVGFGAIAKRLVELLAPFNVNIVGIRRKPLGDEGVPCFPIEEIDHHLAWADHIVNILPLNDSTQGFFNEAVLGRAKPGAVFYNIGRGDTVVQADLIAALSSNHLAAAYLDVTTPEPLPSSDPLWKAPNCFITPHVAGGMQEESSVLLTHFVENLKRFEQGQPLVDRVY